MTPELDDVDRIEVAGGGDHAHELTSIALRAIIREDSTVLGVCVVVLTDKSEGWVGKGGQAVVRKGFDRTVTEALLQELRTGAEEVISTVGEKAEI